MLYIILSHSHHHQSCVSEHEKNRERVKNSDCTFINRGVPQGSVLGPLLFNLFLNDLFYVSLSRKIANYAYDNNIYDSNECLISLKSSISQDAIKTVDWYKANRLEANPEKFQCVLMGRKGAIPTSIQLYDVSIKTSNEINVLGIILDSKLSFNTYVKNICNRASSQINALKRIGKFLNIDARLRIYKSLKRANFSYNPVIWIFCGKSNSDKMERLQERALRFVYSDYITSYPNLFLKSNLLSLSLFRLRVLAIEVYKSVNNLNPQYICDMFSERKLNYDLRNSNLLTQHRFRTRRYGFKSFKFYGAKVWNALPTDIKQITKMDVFKQKLTEWCATNEASKLVIF